MHLGAMPRGNAAAVGPRLGLAAAPQNPRSKPSPGEGERGVPGAAGRDGPEGGTREGSGDVKMQHHPPAPANSPRVCVRREGRREGKEGGGQRRFPAGGGGWTARLQPARGSGARLGAGTAEPAALPLQCPSNGGERGAPGGRGELLVGYGEGGGEKERGKKKEKSKDPPPPCSARSLPHTHRTLAHTHPIDQYLAVLLQLAAVF